MPNVIGLRDADHLFTRLTEGVSTDFGPHCKVRLDDTILSVLNLRGEVLVTLEMTTPKPRIRAKLTRIDGSTITAVNAFLRPYGKVKQYWRTDEYRWHPKDGPASPVMGKPGAPVATAASPVNPSLAPSSVVVPRRGSTQRVTLTVKPAGGKGVTVEEDEVIEEAEVAPGIAVAHQATGTSVNPFAHIETVRRWQDRRTKQPVIKTLTDTISAVDDVLVATEFVKRMNAAKHRREANEPAHMIVTGPAGTAKTRLAMAWAFVHDLPVVIVEGQSIQTASDWFGSLVPNVDRDGPAFVWEWSDAAKLILTGLPCVIVLDELNRPENERALNGIMGLTDWKGVVKPVGAPQALTLAPGQIVIATLNEGPEYVGTVEVDAAVRNRFSTGIPMAFPSRVIEVRVLMAATQNRLDKVVAERLVRVAQSQRAQRDDDTQYPSHNVISPRALVDIAQNIVTGGLTPKEALWANIDSVFIPEDKPALRVLIEAQFGPDPESAGSPDDEEIDRMMAALDL